MKVRSNQAALDANLVASKWYLGELSGEDMPAIAGQALELGLDGKNLRRLAGLANPTRRDVAEIVDGALREMGVGAPISKQEAALWMARRVAGEIIEGCVEPYAGACRIWLSYSGDAPELRQWSDLATSYEVAADKGEIEEARQQILQTARNLRSGADFGVDVARFQQFLEANNCSGKIVWVMPEDVLTTGKRFIYIRVPIPATNELKARRMYEDGVAAGRGLLMSTICGMNASTYCYIWFPKSAEEVPQGIWPHDGSLKLSAKDKSSSPAGRPISDSVLWTLLKFWHRRNQRLKDCLFSETGLITLVRR